MGQVHEQNEDALDSGWKDTDIKVILDANL